MTLVLQPRLGLFWISGEGEDGNFDVDYSGRGFLFGSHVALAFPVGPVVLGPALTLEYHRRTRVCTDDGYNETCGDGGRLEKVARTSPSTSLSGISPYGQTTRNFRVEVTEKESRSSCLWRFRFHGAAVKAIPPAAEGGYVKVLLPKGFRIDRWKRGGAGEIDPALWRIEA